MEREHCVYHRAQWLCWVFLEVSFLFFAIKNGSLDRGKERYMYKNERDIKTKDINKKFNKKTTDC